MRNDVVLGLRSGITRSEEFGITTDQVPFGISVADRRRHLYIIGKTGSGKSTLLRTMLVQDFEAGRGVMLLDPHGDLAEELLNYIPPWRTGDVIYVNPSELSYSVGLNLLEHVPPDDRPLVAASVVATFKHIWRDSWGPRLEYVLYNTVAALLDFPPSRGGISLLGVPRMFTDPDYRDRIVGEIRDPRTRAFWTEEFAAYSPATAAEVVSPVQNKIGTLLAMPAIRHMLGQPRSTLRIDEAMDDGRIIVCNLSKGRLGEAGANLLGSVLVTAVQLAAMRRVHVPEGERTDFVLCLDEFQNFTTDTFASILSEARKYHLGLVISHQFLDQLDPHVRAAVFGNAGTLIAFQLGHDDAAELEGEFAPYSVEALTSLGRGEICVRTVKGGMTAQPFLGKTIRDIGWCYGDRDKVVRQSNRRWAMRREVIEDKLARWSMKKTVPVVAKQPRITRPPMIVNIEHFHQAEPEAPLDAAVLAVKTQVKRVGKNATNS